MEWRSEEDGVGRSKGVEGDGTSSGSVGRSLTLTVGVVVLMRFGDFSLSARIIPSPMAFFEVLRRIFWDFFAIFLIKNLNFSLANIKALCYNKLDSYVRGRKNWHKNL